jgi:predicted acylesterase/phospholipase RssA
VIKQQVQETFRGVVLSGGGARGSYGAGVLIGLREFERLKEPNKEITHFYVGSSVGALNATMAAQGQLDRLVEIYKSKTKQDILGSTTSEISGRKIWWKSSDVPFSYFSSHGLRKLIDESVSWESLTTPLLVTATQYQTGELSTFFRSDFVKKFVDADSKEPVDRRRLKHYREIQNRNDLVQALLASCSIPFFFPPVRIGDSDYVDGGVGNNTPTRQAAYFLRFIAQENLGVCDFIVCVAQDPVSFTLPMNHQMTMSDILLRTIDIFQHELTDRMLEGWERINHEVRKANAREKELTDYVKSAPGISSQCQKELLEKIEGLFHLTTAVTQRRETPLLQVRPSTPLDIERALDFDPHTAPEIIKRGYEDFLGVLEQRGNISPGERRHLSDIPRNRLGF